MKKDGLKGSITIFLSLTCLLFLALICALVESARVQGAKTQSANITGMGSFSLMGEFEKELLEKYEIFGLDGAYGTGTFQIGNVKNQLEEYISYNADPGKDITSFFSFDPWKLVLNQCEIPEYALLTDEHGEPFYQQVVSYMKENIAFIAVDQLKEYTDKKDEIQNSRRIYENEYSHNESDMDRAQQQTSDRRQELQSEAQENGTDPQLPDPNTPNPLTEINKLRRKSILTIVTGGKPVSEKEFKTYGFPSSGGLPKGNMKIEKTHSGSLADLLFREYLIKYFANYTNQVKSNSFEYQLEYILGGKNTDKENLKYVVNHLIDIREAMNYGFCVSDPTCNLEASKLSAVLTGWTGIPGITTVTKHALLLAWAFAESLVDVRTLLEGGKVPLFKDTTTWVLSIEQLYKVAEILAQGGQNKGAGFDYEGYLRILLNMGSLSKQKMRALDLIQYEVRAAGFNYGFQVQNCIVGLKCTTDWSSRPVFAGLPAAVFGRGISDHHFHQESSIAY